jgi:hypothetical protein
MNALTDEINKYEWLEQTGDHLYDPELLFDALLNARGRLAALTNMQTELENDLAL